MTAGGHDSRHRRLHESRAGEGPPADKRSDIWAFGCVLYEMLSGQRAFKGDDVADTLAAVLRQDIDWTALPASTPASVRRLIARCLDRDVRRRLRDIGEARIVLDDPAAPVTRRRGERARPRTAAVSVATRDSSRALPRSWLEHWPEPPCGTSASDPRRRSPVTSIPVHPAGRTGVPSHRPSHDCPVAGRRADGVCGERPAVSPVDVRAGRARDSRHRRLSDCVTDPVFSPDGRSVAFYAAADQTIKTIAVTGGAAVTICPADNPFGMSWGPDGIVFGQGSKGIMRVSPNGGTPDVLVRVKDGEEAHGPQLLPGGQHVLFTLATGTALDRWDKARIVVQSLTSGERKTLIEGGSDARYVPTGHIVYALSGSVFAVAFDVQRLEVKGGAVPMVEGVRRAAGSATGAAHFSFSSTGSLIYIPGPVSTSSAQWRSP